MAANTSATNDGYGSISNETQESYDPGSTVVHKPNFTGTGPAFYNANKGNNTNVTGDYFNNEQGTQNVIKVAGNYNAYGSNEAEIAAKIRQSSALDKLPYAEGASWNSNLACLTGTRLAILMLIHDWSQSRDLRSIFCLQGVAGSGKTAISNAVAQALKKKGILASSFFFDRAIPSRNTPRLLFSTIARDIAGLHPAIAADIAASLEEEPSLATADLSRQFEAFIAGPLSRHPIDRPIIVVIDALDEAVSDDADTHLLAILRDEFAKLPPYFRVLITYRLTRAIEHHLSGKSHVAHHHIDINSAENQEDIAAYVDHHLQNSPIFSPIGTHEPDAEVIRDLKVMAGGLFIWIVTVVRYLRDESNPEGKLRALLYSSHAQGEVLEPTKKIDALYSTILEDSGKWDDKDFRDEYTLFMGSVMAIKRPLSLAALRALHGSNQKLSLGRLPQRFGAILVGLHDENALIHTLHLSFREFVTVRAAESAETQKFFLSEKQHSRKLAELCLQTMVREMTAAPVTGAGYLAEHDDDRPGIPKLTGLSEQLLYGCESWSDHICDIESPSIAVTEILQEFLTHNHITSIEIVASRSTFSSSLSVWRWLNGLGAEFAGLYDEASQAETLYELSIRLHYEGRLEEALAAAEDSVHLRRVVAAQQTAKSKVKLGSPLRHFLPNAGRVALNRIRKAIHPRQNGMEERPETVHVFEKLTNSLIVLSNHLSDLGRHREALAAIQEAVRLLRTLAAERPQAFNAVLAGSLNNLSVDLSSHGRREEALAAIQEAVGLRRALAAERPDAFNAVLAESLNNLSVDLSSHGRHEEALVAIQEAVGLRRALAAERPAAFNAVLASSLNNLSVDLSSHGRHEEALAAIQEAVGLRRALAAERPQAFNDHLAESLNNLSNRLSDHGRHEEALAAIQEAVGLRRALAAERPEAFNAALAESLNNFSAELSDHGRHEEALVVNQEAVGLRRALAAERPAAFNANLADSLFNLSFKFSRLGRHEEALGAIEESVTLHRVLAAERPKVYTSKLSEALRKFSQYLSASGREVEAQVILREAQSLMS
ncbi:hypothetical protein HWV62_19439 [Athelia sp. TMB]|nr:hypothetical protein HWV62_19439 [Athelia sp. TMB]